MDPLIVTTNCKLIPDTTYSMPAASSYSRFVIITRIVLLAVLTLSVVGVMDSKGRVEI